MTDERTRAALEACSGVPTHKLTKGLLQSYMFQKIDCAECHGTGRQSEFDPQEDSPCPICHGDGEVVKEVEL